MTIVEARDNVSNMLLYFVVAEFELRTGKWVLIRCNTGQCNRAHRVLFCVFFINNQVLTLRPGKHTPFVDTI